MEDHVVVKGRKENQKDDLIINSLEGFWSYAKHWLYQYHGLLKTHFPLYLKVVEWRFNHRKINLMLLLRKTLKITLTNQHLVQL